MKRFLNYLLLIGFAASMVGCSSSNNGELVGVEGRKPWFQSEPYGMVFIPMGSFQAGNSSEDMMYSLNSRTKTVSVKAFYMDDTEITNNEYRQFAYWVRDSVAHTILGHVEEDDQGNEFVIWKEDLDYDEAEVREELDELYLDENEKVSNEVKIDTRVLEYSYKYVDYYEAAKRENKGRPVADFVVEVPAIGIYPDTLVWVRDFQFSYNEPQTQNYFYHPAYDDYPVVGVTWDQANAFCDWRTRYLNSYRLGKKLPKTPAYRLPTEWEFEYAARAGHNTSPYPWGGPYLRNDKGCFLANFKPGRGNYSDDGGFYTVKVFAYNPNDYGLFNMSGNVAEWTSTAYDEAIYSTVHDLNPDYKYNIQEGDHKVKTRKVIRGGSWKDVGFYLQNSTRNWEYADSAKSYVGFRCVMDFLGRSIEDFK